MKPCPNCGTIPEVTQFDHIDTHWIACLLCGVHGPGAKSGTAACVAWDALPREAPDLDALVEAVHFLTDGELEWLEILGRGVDFHHPDFAVEHHTLGHDGSEDHVRFEGKSLLDCVRKAREAKVALVNAADAEAPSAEECELGGMDGLARLAGADAEEEKT